MTAALIIAAGKTDRKDRFQPEKQLGAITALERIVTLFKLAGIRRIVVVGDENELPQKLVPAMDLVFLTASAEGEMLDSIKKGLLYLRDKCREALITYADIPMFSRQTVEQLLDGCEEARIPSYRGRCGHPVLLRAECFDRILSYNGGGGLKGAMQAGGIRKQMIETDDAGILAEGEFGTAYEGLLPDHDLTKLRASFQIRISREKGFYGPGIHHLLQLTEEFGSLSRACEHMGMSYTKGRKLIAVMEEQLGAPVLETRQGGRNGGFSHLTDEAKHMMSCYSAFREEAESVLSELFQKHFSGGKENDIR